MIPIINQSINQYVYFRNKSITQKTYIAKKDIYNTRKLETLAMTDGNCPDMNYISTLSSSWVLRSLGSGQSRRRSCNRLCIGWSRDRSTWNQSETEIIIYWSAVVKIPEERLGYYTVQKYCRKVQPTKQGVRTLKTLKPDDRRMAHAISRT